MSRHAPPVAAVFSLVALLASCGSDAPSDPATQDDSAPAQREVDATVGSARDAAAREPSSARDAAQELPAREAVRDGEDAGTQRPGGEDGGRPLPPADAGADDGACPFRGSVTYTLQRSSAPTPAEVAAYAKITMAMDTAVQKYNCYANIDRAVRASYEPSVATADGNPNGNIRFGSDASMHFVTAMHELSHVFGVGAPEYKPLCSEGAFRGASATAKMRELTREPAALVKSDGTHFWPYGLNYVSEHKSEQDLVRHCALVMAIRTDLGL